MEVLLLNVDALRAGYGAHEIVRGVSFSARAGDVVSVIGANGAGKSSLLAAILGVIPLRGGSVTWKGDPFRVHAPWHVAQCGLASTGLVGRVFPALTVEENLEIGALVLRRS